MTTFTFEAYGNTFTTEANTAQEVMEDANRALLWNNPESKDGAWFGDSVQTWVEGNFFD